MSGYQRPKATPGGLRLHLNENTRGCSPSVLERLRRLDATVASLYPDYGAVVQSAARWFGVEESEIVLTNGMDEGIFCATILALRGQAAAEGVIVEPAFDVYEECIKALAGRVRRARFGPGFTLEASDVLAEVTPATRVIFLNDPHNPSGARIPQPVLSAVADGAPDALVFVDEAYVEFGSGSFIDRAIAEHRNVLVGRTFAKAYGLAGLRAGAVTGPAPLIAALRAIVPPYSLNSFAADALCAALEDREYIDEYIAQAAMSRALIADRCAPLGVETFPSDANFVLIRIGDAASRVVTSLAGRGIIIRDRSDQPGCEGCVRLTAGWVADTERALAALEEVLCDVR